MPSERTVLNKTFALTSQQQEGTVTLLDLRAEIRKIPAHGEKATLNTQRHQGTIKTKRLKFVAHY
jgi:hypothetical protein